MLVRLMFILAIAASGLAAGESAAAATSTSDRNEHACCARSEPRDHDGDGDGDDTNDPKNCGGACLMVCCRTVTTLADPVATPTDVAPLATRIILPPLLATDLGEPQSIFHPPRA